MNVYEKYKINRLDYVVNDHQKESLEKLLNEIKNSENNYIKRNAEKILDLIDIFKIDSISDSYDCTHESLVEAYIKLAEILTSVIIESNIDDKFLAVINAYELVFYL